MTTLREHLDAIVDSFDYLDSATHAQAALDILDNAALLIDCADGGDFARFDGSERLVPDPEPA